MGAYLLYHASSDISQQVKCLIVTTFVDTRNGKVRDHIAPNKVIGRLGKFMMNRFPFVMDSFQISISKVSRMKFITNNFELTNLILNRSTSSRDCHSFSFYQDILKYETVN